MGWYVIINMLYLFIYTYVYNYLFIFDGYQLFNKTSMPLLVNSYSTMLVAYFCFWKAKISITSYIILAVCHQKSCKRIF